jgi:hypothetical protein
MLGRGRCGRLTLGCGVQGAATAFDAGALEQAEQLAAQALKQNPGDAQAGYLTRVVEREKQLRRASGNNHAAR